MKYIEESRCSEQLRVAACAVSGAVRIVVLVKRAYGCEEKFKLQPLTEKTKSASFDLNSHKAIGYYYRTGGK